MGNTLNAGEHGATSARRARRGKVVALHALLALGLASCADRSVPPASSASAAATDGAQAPPAPVSDGAEEQASCEAVPESLQRLAAATRELGVERGQPNPEELARAFDALASAASLLPGVPQHTAAELHEKARMIESVSPMDRVPPLQEGLMVAIRALSTRSVPEEHASEYRASVRTLSQATSALSRQTPPSDQRSIAASAFRAATDATYLARSAEPPFGEAMAGGFASPPPRKTPEEYLEEARGDVLQLGQVRFPHARSASADALSSLANLIEASDEEQQQAERVSIMRLQAERLASADLHSFGQAKWAKAGLSTALDALDALRSDKSPTLEQWNDAARDAVANIREQDALSFQRAALQDGFRATVGVFAVAVTQGAL